MPVGSVRAIEEEGKIIIEWKIDDFLRLGSDEIYDSPYFNLSGVRGRLRIDPSNRELDEPFKYAEIGLELTSMPEHRANATPTFSLKTVDGESDLKTTIRFNERLSRFSMYNFISRSDLIERQSELLPSGDLTLICTLNSCGPSAVSDDVPISSVSTERQFLETAQTEEATGRIFLDASAQTEEVAVSTQHEVLDASAQTDEGTGVWELQKHLQEISLSGNVSDVILKADGQVFKAHRCILAARSPVFSAMMSNEMKENATGVVDVKDVDPHIMSDFLHYLYTGSTECLTPENVAKLYAAADKYQVDVLKENCLGYMLMNVSVENFCDIFSLSVKHNEEKLKEMCIQYFATHLLDIIQTCKWQTFLCENPIICNELHIKLLKLKYLVPQT